MRQAVADAATANLAAGGQSAAELFDVILVRKGHKDLWGEAFDGPSGVRWAIEEPVVQPGWPALPKFEAGGLHPEAAPERRQWNFAVFEFLTDFREFLHEKFA